MLRLPAFRVEKPTTLAGVVALLLEHGEAALPIAGGTDLLPNMKHRLFEPEVLVSLEAVAELRGLRAEEDGTLVLGAMTRLSELAASPLVRAGAPALAQAVGIVAGPQLRNMGTLGGNVMLDTRCQWYNQTYFWRKALGFCLKKDGTECHVVQGGSRCVAAASNDSAPALTTLDAELRFVGPAGERTLPIEEFWTPDGTRNKRTAPEEVLVEVRIPPRPAGHRGAYGKLRDRGSIDFPLLGVAARLDLDAGDAVERADLVLTALQARPLRVKKRLDGLLGTRPGTKDFAAALEAVCAQSFRQCHPMPNIPGDHDYRREMVPVYVRRTFLAAADGRGPVQHV